MESESVVILKLITPVPVYVVINVCGCYANNVLVHALCLTTADNIRMLLLANQQ